jgi:signal transduction histidine kinase
MWYEISYYPIRKGNEIIGTACHSRNITERKKAKLNLEKQNEELAFQNEEKENRAAELVIANKELAFQNEEKENRATELITTNNELLKTNSELDRFVYSVSHDLRSPLTSVLGLLSFIEEETEEADTLEHAKMIRNSINRLDDFIKNILSYSRNNRISLEIEKIPIQQTATAIVDSLHSMKQAKGIHFEIDIQELQSFYSDSLRFNTILENLVSNAIKYHKKNQADRYIRITGKSENDKLELTVADNGIGISPAHHNKIFDMFFRLSGKTEGSGIGLYIVKETVEKLEGSIQVESELGTGTKFTITLKNLKP